MRAKYKHLTFVQVGAEYSPPVLPMSMAQSKLSSVSCLSSLVAESLESVPPPGPLVPRMLTVRRYGGNTTKYILINLVKFSRLKLILMETKLLKYESNES